ncbi:MAG TPA: LamG-like jellyroll fold domain-containing protein, partial [Amycolatopsis sp.]|nr:LamG-like jellyroll fold domain-containing protein [Amycolatopsis sp.]
LAATPTGLTEQLVLAGRDAPVSYTYTLALTGLQPRLNATGDVELVAGDKIFGVLPAGQMWDSANPPARSSNVHYGLRQTGPGTWKLSLDIDPAWLHDPARAFPVVVDPSAGQFNVDTDDTYVRSDNGGRNSLLLAVGHASGALSRSYLHLGNALNQLRNDFIVSGTLNLKTVDATNAGGQQVSAFEVTQPWSGNPGWPGPAVGRLLGQSGPVASSSNPSWVGVPFDPNVLTDWSHGAAIGNGVSVRAANEAAANGILFESADNGGNQVPFLDVRYAPDGATYQVTDVLQPTNNAAGWMTVQVTNRGATTWNGNYHFGYWIQETNTLYQATPLPTVGPGGVTTLSQVPIGPLPPGKYHVVLSIWDPAGKDFASADGVPNGVFDLNVDDVAPTSDYQQPAVGDTVETLTPTLYAQGVDPDKWPGKGLTYKFRVCTDSALTEGCQESGWGGPSWSPPADALYWGKTYFWGVLVDDTVKQTPCWVGPTYDTKQQGCVLVPDSPSNLRFTTRVAQPEITSHLAGSPGTVEGPGLDPQIGNYSLANTDSAVKAVGPSLGIDRTYNSLDPRRDTAFGLGWASRLDMKLSADGDGSGNVVLTYPDGRQLRFGHNPDDSYTSPMGDSTLLDHKNSGSASFTLRDASGSEWLFDASLRLSAIIDPAGLRQNLHYADGTDQIDRITNAIANGPADRTLSLTWTGNHVTAVAEPAPSVGAPAPTWTYTYNGDQLTGACAPGAAPNCTTYGYAAGSHYRSSVSDDKPQAYYRFDEQPNSTTTLASAVAQHPGGENATAYGVFTDSAPGPLAGTSDGAATFTGNGYIVLPQGMTTETMSPSVEMWFKTTGSGTLFALQDKDFAPGAGAGAATPVLYVGTDGLLYGGFGMQPGSGATQIVSQGTVNDGAWHHAALSAAIGAQTLYLDGVAVGTLNGLIDQKQMRSAVLGAGYAKGYPATNDGDFYFNGGSIDEAAIYHHTLGALAVAEHYAAAKAASELTSVKLPQDNRGYATLTYDDLNDRASTLVDHLGLKWTIDPATVNATEDNSLGYERWTNPVRTAVIHGPAGYGDWTYTFDAAAAGRIVKSTHDNATRSYEYNTSGFLSASVDEDGDRFEQTTDDRGNVLSKKSCRAAGSCNTGYYTYLTPSNPLDPRGNKVATSSDARSSGPSDTTYQTTYSYDSAGRPTGTTSPVPNGQTQHPSTSIVYSDGSQASVDGGNVPAGLPVKSTGARGQVTTYLYYRNGDLAETDDPAGLRTQRTYDALGRVLTTTTLNGGGVAFGVTSYTYTLRSQVATRTDPQVTNPITGAVHAKVTSYSYDGDGNITGLTESDTL